MSLKSFIRSLNIKPIKLHALRACFASQMLFNSEPVSVVMKGGDNLISIFGGKSAIQ